jgi:glycosyltransferase involved in cell wall biosynthesis
VRIRVLEVLASLKRAGAERMAVSLACRLDPNRFETAVVSLFDAFPNGLEPVLAVAGVKTWHLGKHPGLDPRMVARLFRVMREYRPAVIHTHSYVLRYSLPAGLAARAGAMVHTVHNLAAKEVDLAGRLIQRIAFRRRVAAVAVGEQVRRSFRELYGAEPAATIPNGIDADAFRKPGARQQWRQENGFAEGDFLIASVARLEPQKNPLGLIESFAQAFGTQAFGAQTVGVQAFGDDPGRRLLLAGDGSLRDAAREYAARRGVGERVHFLGVRADVAEMLAACDLFASSSHWEGSPLAVMEAMAAGLPVVATAVGSVPELVADGETGLLVPPGEERTFAAALASLARDPGRRHELAAAALRRAAAFGADAMVAAYAGLFERLAGATPGATP